MRAQRALRSFKILFSILYSTQFSSKLIFKRGRFQVDLELGLGPFVQDVNLNVHLVADLRWIQRRLSHQFRARFWSAFQSSFSVGDRPGFSVVLDLDFCPGCDPGFACISVFPVFGVLGGTRFWSILGRVLDRVSGVFETRLSIQPYKNCSPDTLPIRTKSAHPLLFRSVGK
jgi:hypothetical protein